MFPKLFWCVWQTSFSRIKHNRIFWKTLLNCWCVLYYKLLFWMRVSGSVSFSVYMKIFKKCCLTCFWKMSQKFEQFSYGIFFLYLFRFWGNWVHVATVHSTQHATVYYHNSALYFGFWEPAFAIFWVDNL